MQHGKVWFLLHNTLCGNGQFNRLYSVIHRRLANDARQRVSRQVELFTYAPPLRDVSMTQLKQQLEILSAAKNDIDIKQFHLLRGNLNYNLGHWAAAHRDFTKALAAADSSIHSSSATQSSPNEVDESLAKQVSCLIQLKEFQEAANEIAKIEKPHIQAWLKAHIAFLTENLSESLEFYSQAIKSAPEAMSELYFNRGVVYTSMRKHEEALQDFTRSLDTSPSENFAALRWRGEVLAKLDRNKEAIDDLTEALKTKYEDPLQVFQISYWLGMCHLNSHQLEQAFTYLRYFDVIAEEIPSAKYQRARVLVQLGRYKEALADLEGCSLLLEAGAIEQSDFLKGQCLYNTNEPSKALECLTKCEELSPNFKETSYTFLMLRGDCHFVLGRYTSALHNFKKAFDMVPPQIALRIPQTQPVVDMRITVLCFAEELQSGVWDLRAAINSCVNPHLQTGQELDKIAPQKPTVQTCMQIGNLYLFIGQAEKSVEQYTQAIQLSGQNNYEVYIARGIAHMALGSTHEKDSLQDFLHAQSLDSENAKDSVYYIGELYFHNKKYEQAKTHFLEALRILPKDNTEFISLSHFYLGGCYWNLNDSLNAVESTTEAIKIKKDNKFLLQRAQYFDQLGKYDEAIIDFTELLSMDDAAEVYEQRARCYLRKKKYENAATDISKALALKPNSHADWYSLRAQIYVQVDAYAQAIRDLDTAISLDPTNPQLYFLRSSCYHHSEQFSSCVSDCQHALELWHSPVSPTSTSSPPPQLHITHGSALFHLGEYETSATRYKAALGPPSLTPSSTVTPSPSSPSPLPTTLSSSLISEILFGLGRSQLFCGRSEEAMKHFEKAVQLWPAISDKLQILQNQLAQFENAN